MTPVFFKILDYLHYYCSDLFFFFPGTLATSTSLSCSLLGFYLVPLSGTYLFATSFGLTFCVCGPTGCRIIVPLAFGCLPYRAGLKGLCRLPGRRDYCLPSGGWNWVLFHWRAELCQGLCVEVIRGGCWLRMTLGNLSADGWDCVPILLAVWLEAFQLWSL